MSQETPTPPVTSPLANAPSVESPRRGFLTGVLAIVIGGLISLFPVVTGLFVFLDPLRKRNADGPQSGAQGATVDSEGFVRVASVDSLRDDGTPRFFAVIADHTDAWTYFPKQPIGAVFLRKTGDDVTAFNVECPHAGCGVSYDSEEQNYHCPCHDSSFSLAGQRSEDSPSPRDLDSLQIKQQDGFVWVKFQVFQKGTSERIAES